ncbi:MAG TPA: LysR family transcriptional regulator [Polyangiaceae bacterium]
MIPNPILETRDLRLVHAIAEAGGATQAARLLHLSQSAVSHQLRGLEERLGVPMFEREGRKLRITPAGERVVQLSRDVLGPLAHAELELRRGAGLKRPKLRIATQCYTAYHWLPQALAALSARHPEIDLTIVSETAGDVASALEDNRLDLALCVIPPPGRNFGRQTLFRDELVLAVARGHRLAKKKYVEGRDLSTETLIQNEVESSQRERVRKMLFKEGQGFARVIRIPVTDAILELVQAGMGVGLFADFMLRARVERGELEAVPLTRSGIHRTWTGVFRRASPLVGPIATLLHAVKQEAVPSG